MTRAVPLRDLLPTEALAEIEQLAKEGHCDVEHLKIITNRYKDELLAKGVDADYLAYAIERSASQQVQSQKTQEPT